MALSFINSGTATVAGGGTVVTGQNTAWANQVRAGDFFGVHAGYAVRIASVDSNTQLTLAYGWPGDAQTGAPYEIAVAGDPQRYQETTRELFELLGTHAFFEYDASGALADRDQYDGQAKGFSFLDTSADPAAIYYKSSAASGDWAGPFAFVQGEKGDAATVSVGSTTTVAPGTPAAVTNSGTSNAAVLEFDIPQGTPGTDGAPGAAATIQVGAVTTLPAGSDATVANVGTTGDAVFDFGIPKGLDGTGAGDVVGPAASTDANLALFDGTTGKALKDGGYAINSAGPLADSAATVPAENVVKAYADTKGALSGTNTWAGVQTFSGNQIKITGAAPAQDFVQTDGPDYRWQLNGNGMTLLADPDDNGSFDTTALNINAATQTVSVFGADLKGLNADGGFTFDLGTPSIDMDGIFTGTWKTNNRIDSISTGVANTGTYSTMFVRREGEGLAASGATNSDMALFIETVKTDYLTSTTEGQVLGTYTNIYGGRLGDHAAHLFSAAKVFDGTYSGGLLGVEGSIIGKDASGTTTRYTQCYMGWSMSGTGTNFAPDGTLGFCVEPRVGETFAAYAAVERDDLTGSPAFEYILAAGENRDNTNMFFSISGSGNASGSANIVGGTKAPFTGASSATEDGYTLWGIGLLSLSRSAAPTLDFRRRTSDGSIVLFRRDTTQVGSISVTTTATAYNTSSDERLKNFIGEYDPLKAIDIIRRDPVREFDWKSTGERAVGWGAQTSYAVSSDLATPPGDDGEYWSLDQSRRTPYLWAFAGFAADKLDELESRIANLEGAAA